MPIIETGGKTNGIKDVTRSGLTVSFIVLEINAAQSA